MNLSLLRFFVRVIHVTVSTFMTNELQLAQALQACWLAFPPSWSAVTSPKVTIYHATRFINVFDQMKTRNGGSRACALSVSTPAVDNRFREYTAWTPKSLKTDWTNPE